MCCQRLNRSLASSSKNLLVQPALVKFVASIKPFSNSFASSLPLASTRRVRSTFFTPAVHFLSSRAVDKSQQHQNLIRTRWKCKDLSPGEMDPETRMLSSVLCCPTLTTSFFWSYAHYSKFPIIKTNVTFIKNFVMVCLAKLTAKPDFLTRFGSSEVSFALIRQKSGFRVNDQ